MSQFDSSTYAALAQIEFEELTKTPGAEIAEIIKNILALLIPGAPLAKASTTMELIAKIRSLAGAGYTSNLIYVTSAVRDDLKILSEQYEELRKRIKNLPCDPHFVEAISALALHAMQTSVKERLRRLARIVVNGVREDDLEPENLDDMMRAAVALKEADIALLKTIYDQQSRLLGYSYDSYQWSDQIAATWSGEFEKTDTLQHVKVRASLMRLQSSGLIASVETTMVRDGSIAHQPFGLLPDGKVFIERLQAISTLIIP